MLSRRDYAISEKIFASFGSGSGVAEKLFQKKLVFLFRSHDSFSRKAVCTITTKLHTCRFLVPKRFIQHVRASFALCTVVETGSSDS